jgi:cellobiose epimerase
MDRKKITEFQKRVRKELDENIIPFWMNRTIDSRGGFIGRMTNGGAVDEKAPKGLVLNSRILWTFSALYEFEKKPEYLALAKRAYDYMVEYFLDKKYGGMFWMLDWQGRPLEDKKQVYGQAFAIYALSEYYRATNSNEALENAKTIFELVEKHARDEKYMGYFETYDRDWKMAKEQRLSVVDMVEKKSMNTHLHLLEGLANFYDVCKDAAVGRRVEELLEIFAGHIISPSGSFCQLFFDEPWNPKSRRVSFGHDIEASWLLERDAEILGRQDLLEKIQQAGLKLAEAVYRNGLDGTNSLFYEAEPSGISNSEKHFWVQIEAIVGFLNAYQLCGKHEYFDVALNIWKFIEDHFIDRKNGEWFYVITAQGKVDNKTLKVSEWKCPYHNSRGCMEIINRLEQIKNKT